MNTRRFHRKKVSGASVKNIGRRQPLEWMFSNPKTITIQNGIDSLIGERTFYEVFESVF